MRRRLPAPFLPVLACMLAGGLLTGCGGGSEPDRVSARALTREAEQICAAGKEESDRLRSRAVPGAHGEAAGTEIDATLEALDTQIEGFAALRGPAATDVHLEALVRHLRAAATGLEQLRDAAVAGDLTVDEAVQADPALVRRVNRSSAQASDDLVALGWPSCIGVAG